MNPVCKLETGLRKAKLLGQGTEPDSAPALFTYLWEGRLVPALRAKLEPRVSGATHPIR